MRSVRRDIQVAVPGQDVEITLWPAAAAKDIPLDAWLGLEARASDQNAFLSPHFVIPALRLLAPPASARLLTVSRMNDGRAQLCALGVFQASLGSTHFPWPHLRGYLSPHSYLSGLLVDASYKPLVADALASFLRSRQHLWRALWFTRLHRSHTGDGGPFRPGARHALRWTCREVTQRSVLRPAGQPALYETILGDRRKGKDIRRRLRRLNELGTVSWRILRGKEISTKAVETFLRLENAGWKGDLGTSLLARPERSEFFREMIARFREDDRGFFTELSVDDTVIASTSNLTAGRSGFAFKIGWDQAYRAVSPGILNEMEMIRQAGSALVGIDHLDSGARPGSFIDRLWPDRITLETGVLSTGMVSAGILAASGGLRQLRQRIVGRTTDGEPHVGGQGVPELAPS